MRLNPLGIALLALLAACSDPASRTQAQSLKSDLVASPPIARKVPTDVGGVRLSFAPVVRRAAPAVVNISSKRVVRQQADPFWELFGGGAPQNRVEGSLGSGVIVRADGVIITNNHVIENGQEITVSLADRREFPAKVLLADPRADLAVLKIDAAGLPVLPIYAGDDLQVGDLVLAIGDPFGVGQTVTNGIISALNRTDVGSEDAFSYIQTDAAINPGNSGGALVDMNGALIGVNSFILSRSGGSVGVGFAIPGAVVRQVVDAAVGGVRAVVRPWLGVSGQTVNAEIAKSLGLDRPIGVLVNDVFPSSPAAHAGLVQGDVILAIDGQPVNDETFLTYRVGGHKAGETVMLAFRRHGMDNVVKAVLQAPPANPPRDQQTLSGSHPLDGATVVNLSPAVATELGGDPFAKGVLITALARGLASNAGFRPGDVIIAVDGHPCATIVALKAALTGGARRWRVTLVRNGQQIEGNFAL